MQQYGGPQGPLLHTFVFQPDIRFPIAQKTLLWQPILGANRQKLAYLTLIYCTGIPQRIGRSQRRWTTWHSDDPSTSSRNLMSVDGLVTQEFKRLMRAAKRQTYAIIVRILCPYVTLQSMRRSSGRAHVGLCHALFSYHYYYFYFIKQNRILSSNSLFST